MNLCSGVKRNKIKTKKEEKAYGRRESIFKSFSVSVKQRKFKREKSILGYISDIYTG